MLHDADFGWMERMKHRLWLLATAGRIRRITTITREGDLGQCGFIPAAACGWDSKL